VGGAERGARKRRQSGQAAKAVAQARGETQSRRRVIVTVAVVLVLAAAVIGGVLWTNASKNQTAGQNIAPQTGQPVAAGVVEQRQGSAVSVGKPDAKVTIDEYADFLCPHCGEFQKVYGQQVQNKINQGSLRVNYHMIPLLNNSSDPPGYSLESANASLCAADSGKFTPFHDSLYAKQPGEGSRGYDKNQLVQLGQSLGITDPNFPNCVQSGAYEQQIINDYNQLQTNPNFKGTPTVLRDGQSVDFSDPGWLDKLTGSTS
jgi:protein-disulfide isomerase